MWAPALFVLLAAPVTEPLELRVSPDDALERDAQATLSWSAPPDEHCEISVAPEPDDGPAPVPDDNGYMAVDSTGELDLLVEQTVVATLRCRAPDGTVRFADRRVSLVEVQEPPFVLAPVRRPSGVPLGFDIHLATTVEQGALHFEGGLVGVRGGPIVGVGRLYGPVGWRIAGLLTAVVGQVRDRSDLVTHGLDLDGEGRRLTLGMLGLGASAGFVVGPALLDFDCTTGPFLAFDGARGAGLAGGGASMRARLAFDGGPVEVAVFSEGRGGIGIGTRGLDGLLAATVGVEVVPRLEL